MVSFTWYEKVVDSFLSKKIGYVADDIYVMLVKAGYTPDQAAHQYLSDVVPGTNEIANGNGYVTNGLLVTNKALTQYVTGKNWLLVGDDSSWAAANWTAGNGPSYAVLYDRTPATDATRPLLGYIPFGGEQNPNGVQFLLDYNTIQGSNTLLELTIS
ncbi:MAG: hypothetical protein WCE94_12160 [Candidatus Methanoperedens sp.]